MYLIPRQRHKHHKTQEIYNNNKEDGDRKPRLSAARSLGGGASWPRWSNFDRSFGLRPIGSDMLLIVPKMIADCSRQEL